MSAFSTTPSYYHTQFLNLSLASVKCLTPRWTLLTWQHPQSKLYRIRNGVLRPLRALEPTEEEAAGSAETRMMEIERKPPSKLIGILSLLIVAFLWGTCGPGMKLVFSSPKPPLPSTLSFIKASISTALFLISLWLAPVHQKTVGDEMGKAKRKQSGNWLTWSSGLLWLSALELGLWDACGTFAQTIGISMTSPINAAFLIHTVTVFTPFLSSFTGDRLGSLGWFRCALSIVGCLFVTISPSSLQSSKLTVGSAGDIATITAATFYAISTVRVGTLIRDFSPRQLAIGNALVAFGGATIWTLTDLHRLGGHIDSLWPGYAQLIPWMTILWTAIGGDTIASFLRNSGQRILPPSRAQLLFATTPFWSVYVASHVLHLDVMRMETWIGGGFILISALLSALD